MIASLVLFYSTFALRTCFSICHDPSDVFTFIRILGFPLVCDITWTRTMWFLSALEAEWVPTFAIYITDTVIFIFHTVVATWEGTPSDIFVVISEWLAKPFHVSLQIISLKVFQELRMRHYHIAHVLRTRSLHALNITVVYLLYQIFPPTFSTKLMPARQTISFSTTLIKLRVTYTAETLVIRFQSCFNVRKVFYHRGIKFYSDLVLEFVFLVKPVCH